MSLDKVHQARCRYAHDLRSLRESRGVSLEEIHAETRIITSVLLEYEANCLCENESFNNIYLRSLTKKYAEAVSLDVDKILNGLAMALEGNYDGRLNPNYEPEESSMEKPVKQPESGKGKEKQT